MSNAFFANDQTQFFFTAKKPTGSFFVKPADKSGSLAVIITSPLTNTNILYPETLQFTAIVSNNTDQSLIWSVDDIVGGNSTVGTISATGLFTPVAYGLHTIKAVSVVYPLASESIEVNVINVTASLTFDNINTYTVAITTTDTTTQSTTINGVSYPSTGTTFTINALNYLIGSLYTIFTKTFTEGIEKDFTFTFAGQKQPLNISASFTSNLLTVNTNRPTTAILNILVDGVTIVPSNVTYPYTYSVDISTYNIGQHTIQAKLTDSSDSTIVTSDVYDFTGTKLPDLTVTATLTGNNYVIDTSRENDVDLTIYINSTLVATIQNSSISSWPYTYVIDPTQYSGSNTIYVTAIDSINTGTVTSATSTFIGTKDNSIPITYGSSTVYTITSDSPISHRGANFHGGIFSFYGTQGDVVNIYAETTDSTGTIDNNWDNYMYLLDNNKNTLTFNDDGQTSGNTLASRISNYILPYTGLYYIDVSPYTAAFNLTFKLTLAKV